MPTYRSLTCVLFVVLGFALIASSQSQNQSVPAEALEKVRNGNALFDKENYAAAQKEYEAAIALDWNWYEPHYELGQTYSRIQRQDDAHNEYETALKLEPNCWICYEGLGNLADDAGDHEAAIQNYQKAVNLAPDQARLQYNLGIAYLRMKKVDEGIAALKGAEKLKPNYASPYFLLGNFYYEQKKYYLASDQFLQATKIEKSGPRFDQAKKLNDVQIVIDEKLKGDSIGCHLAYCLARSGSMLPEQYLKRYPGAETYTETLAEEESVLGTFATIMAESGETMHAPPDLARLVIIKKAGYLVPFILVSSKERFLKEGEEFEKQNPGRLEEFRTWAAKSKISLDPIRPRCEVRWMGESW